MASKRCIYFYVDGKSEKAIKEKIDQSNVSPIFVQRTKNGRDVSLEAIANECSIYLNSYGKLGNGHIFIIDKEKRSAITAKEMENTLKTKISAKATISFDLVVADTMFENWILSDIESVSVKHHTYLLKTNNCKTHEGINGTSKLDELWVQHSTKYSSDKVTNSRKLFKSVNPNYGIKYSNSFNEFISILNKHNIILY